MGLLLRGLAWIGLYLGVVLLPLAVALASRLSTGSRAGSLLAAGGVAAGILGFSLLASEFGLVSRLRAAARPFGTDALMYFHRLMGITAALFVLAHAGLLLAAGYPWQLLNPAAGTLADSSGAIAFWLALLLVLLSVLRRRLRLRYEWWQSSHSLLAAAVVLAALLHALAHLGAIGDRWLAPLLLGYAVLFFALLLHYRLLRPLGLRHRAWRIVENRDEGASTRTLVLEPEGHDGMAFEPGQFAWLSTGDSPYGFGQHPLSMSSSAEAPARLEFSVKALGDWSGAEVPSLAPGRRVFVDGPYGAFTPERHPAEGLVLIAGGVGVTPMRSMLLSMRDRGDPRPVLLLHAAHDPSRAIFREELAALQSAMNLRVVPVYESPPGGQGERGYVTAEVLRRHLPAAVVRWQCFVCGPPAMMHMVETALEACGVPAERIHSERFDLV